MPLHGSTWSATLSARVASISNDLLRVPTGGEPGTNIAIMAKFSGPDPVASATWQVNLLSDAARSEAGGWWLLRSRVEHARGGYSSQDMTVFGEGGRPVAVSRQCVAIFDKLKSKL